MHGVCYADLDVYPVFQGHPALSIARRQPTGSTAQATPADLPGTLFTYSFMGCSY